MPDKKQFIGKNEILKIKGSQVTFVPDNEGNSKTEEYSEETLKNIITEEPIDLTLLRDKKCFPVAEEILEVLLKHNIYLSELEFILQRVVWSIAENRNKAEDKLWGSEEGKKTIKQLDSILKG